MSKQSITAGLELRECPTNATVSSPGKKKILKKIREKGGEDLSFPL
jgi:hypothetical protein